jgi:choline dehydrogenase-like flavoprotein
LTIPTADPTIDSPDVLIVGSGIMGAAVAALLRETRADARILMIDGGPTAGEVPGRHLHDSTDPAIADRYNQRVSTGIQGMYTGASLRPDIGDDLRSVEPGMYSLAAIGQETTAMPAAAVSWNVGGMGVHWTAATPWPDGVERFDFGDADRWERDLDRARRLLHVHPGPLGPTRPGQTVLDVLEEMFGGTSPDDRHPQAMPMAVRADGAGRLVRTGPAAIFPVIAANDDPAFELRAGTVALAVLHDGDHARGARVHDVAMGSDYEIEAGLVVVCADAIRTPQLLFASGIRPSALGRYLNEHAFVTSRVLMDVERFGLTLDGLPRALPGEFATDSLWLPQNGPAQPFHGQIMNSVYVDEHDESLAYSVGVSLYAPVESRRENRLLFSETERDAVGMPRLTVEFDYSPTDRALIESAVGRAREIAERFGPVDPATELALLPPGSSLHQTGTVRMGAVDDGTSVCDPDGRVWGFDNVFLAGNGVIPTPVVCNATLTGMVTAVRAARAAVAQLELPPQRAPSSS